MTRKAKSMVVVLTKDRWVHEFDQDSELSRSSNVSDEPLQTRQHPESTADAAEARAAPMTLDRAKLLATLSVQDVADLLGIPVKTVYARATKRNDGIPGRINELGRTCRFRAPVVVAWLCDVSARKTK